MSLRQNGNVHYLYINDKITKILNIINNLIIIMIMAHCKVCLSCGHS